MRDNDELTHSKTLPRPGNPEQGQLGIDRWLQAIESLSEPELLANCVDLVKQPECYDQCMAVFGNSPYLVRCAISEAKFFYWLLREGYDSAFERTIQQMESDNAQNYNSSDIESELRICKTRIALIVALADISHRWDVPRVTGALTRFADLALKSACRFAILELMNKYSVQPNQPNNPEYDSGIIIVGMGKLGAGELNYSSDIDIIIFYDPDKISYIPSDDLQKSVVKLSRTIVRLIDQPTAKGYVFRTDLRLRPDPSSTPMAVSVPFAEKYYQNRGRNWERAAFIKARAVAGDIEAGHAFLHNLQSFIWKEDLDFAAIREMGFLKRQIDKHKNTGSISVLKHNVKLGRGGIREIEFIAQTRQLVWGGRRHQLRSRSTVEVLQQLVDIEELSKKQSDDLIETYLFLRRVEHRIQMTNDEQTHSIPATEEGVNLLSVFLGFVSREKFERSLIHHLERVDKIFVQLFEVSLITNHSESLGTSAFEDVGLKQMTMQSIAQFGYTDSVQVYYNVNNLLSTLDSKNEIKEKVLNLLPTIIEIFGGLNQSDVALARITHLLSCNQENPSLYALLAENPHLLGTISIIIDNTVGLTDRITTNPMLLESLVLYDFIDPVPSFDELVDEISSQLQDVLSIPERVNVLFRWANDREFQVGVQILSGLVDAKLAATNYDDIRHVFAHTLKDTAIFWRDDINQFVPEQILAFSLTVNDEGAWHPFSETCLRIIYHEKEKKHCQRLQDDWDNLVSLNTEIGYRFSQIEVLTENEFLKSHEERIKQNYLQLFTSNGLIYIEQKLLGRLQKHYFLLVEKGFRESLISTDQIQTRWQKWLGFLLNSEINDSESLQQLDLWLTRFAEYLNFLKLKSLTKINFNHSSHEFSSSLFSQLDSLNQCNVISNSQLDQIQPILEDLQTIRFLLQLNHLSDDKANETPIPVALKLKIAERLDMPNYENYGQRISELLEKLGAICLDNLKAIR